MTSNPAAILWAVYIGCEPRITSEHERTVRAMVTTSDGTYFSTDELKTIIQQNAAKDARIAELEAQLAAAQERERGLVVLLSLCEWGSNSAECPICHGLSYTLGHAGNCKLKAALAAAQKGECDEAN